MNNFVSNVGNIELDNDCNYSLERRSTRSRESTVPKEDMDFYFNTYILPKYGLGNLNVSNVASFMKDLEMNWTKLSPDLKDKVMDILVDHILTKNYDFKNALLKKLNVPVTPITNTVLPVPPTTATNNKSSFGSNSDNTNTYIILVTIIGFVLLIALLNKKANN